jgi:hypothetical protein
LSSRNRCIQSILCPLCFFNIHFSVFFLFVLNSFLFSLSFGVIFHSFFLFFLYSFFFHSFLSSLSLFFFLFCIRSYL